MRAAPIIALLVACTGAPAVSSDLVDTAVALEFTTRIGPPQQEACLTGGTFVLDGSDDAGSLTMVACGYGGVALDASSPIAVTEAIVPTQSNIAEDTSTLAGSVVVSSDDEKRTCSVAMTITRTNIYTSGSLLSSTTEASGTLCDQHVDCFLDGYPAPTVPSCM